MRSYSTDERKNLISGLVEQMESMPTAVQKSLFQDLTHDALSAILSRANEWQIKELQKCIKKLEE